MPRLPRLRGPLWRMLRGDKEKVGMAARRGAALDELLRFVKRNDGRLPKLSSGLGRRVQYLWKLSPYRLMEAYGEGQVPLGALLTVGNPENMADAGGKKGG